tara:strand:+ start:3076 stop:5349 length:2274 start_codon:yes stop_codon:yes gene_type:complete
VNYEELKTRDFEDDHLDPKSILDHVSAHDREMREKQPRMALAKASYITRFWEWVEGNKAESTDAPYRLGRLDRIQVNRIKPALSGYLNSLYPRRMRAIYGPDPAGTGDPKFAELTMNRWFNSNNVRDRILLCSRQALLYPGAGVKVGYDAGTSSAIDRTWIRAFPWWELVLDRASHDWDDARFIGHAYYRPKHEVEEEYGLPELSGASRVDYLSSSALGGTDQKRTRSYGKDDPKSDNSHFVRVLEVCNLVDEYEDEEDPSIRYKGRLEIYVLDQGEMSTKPIYMGPMPFSNPDGSPLPHIAPLIFEHEPEYPYRGLAYVEQLLPQQLELNSYRSYMSQASRKDSRQYVTKKGVLDSETKTMLMDGEEGLVVEVDEAYQGSLANIITPIQHGPISTNIREHMATVERDLERGMTLSPAALGVVTKATAQEIRAVEAHTESEFGRHAEARDRWLESVLKIALRAICAAMQDRGDSDGAYEYTDEEVLAPTDASISDGEVEEASEAAAEDASEEAQEELSIDESEEEQLVEGESISAGVAEADVRAEPWPLTTSDVQEEQVLDLITPNGEFVQITVADLDSDFVVGFTESGRSPMADSEMKQNLMGLMEQYFQLLDLMSKGGVVGVAARAYMEALHDRFQLPESLSPDAIEFRAAKDAEDEEAGAQAAPPQPGGAPPPSPAEGQQPPPEQGQPAGLPDEIKQIVQEAMQLPPGEALQVFGRLFENDPEMSQIIQEAMQLPPEGQVQAVQRIAQGLMGGQ